jgi:hypothetical protein
MIKELVFSQMELTAIQKIIDDFSAEYEKSPNKNSYELEIAFSQSESNDFRSLNICNAVHQHFKKNHMALIVQSKRIDVPPSTKFKISYKPPIKITLPSSPPGRITLKRIPEITR